MNLVLLQQQSNEIWIGDFHPDEMGEDIPEVHNLHQFLVVRL